MTRLRLTALATIGSRLTLYENIALRSIDLPALTLIGTPSPDPEPDYSRNWLLLSVGVIRRPPVSRFALLCVLCCLIRLCDLIDVL